MPQIWCEERERERERAVTNKAGLVDGARLSLARKLGLEGDEKEKRLSSLLPSLLPAEVLLGRSCCVKSWMIFHWSWFCSGNFPDMRCSVVDIFLFLLKDDSFLICCFVYLLEKIVMQKDCLIKHKSYNSRIEFC